MKKLSQNLSLAFQLARRDVAARYRGSLLGILWSFINPLLLLAVYGIVFSLVFKSHWGSSDELDFPLILFSGLILHSFFTECMMRSPTIILHNSNYVKKVVFPLDILPLTVALSALFHFLISFGVLLLGVYLLKNNLPYTILFLPVVILPFIIFLCGVTWLLASVGVFLRDISQIMSLVCTVALFISPIFYPVNSAPVFLQKIIYFNPLTVIVENLRAIVVYNQPPDFQMLTAYTIAALGIFIFGYFWFLKTRKGFADVV